MGIDARRVRRFPLLLLATAVAFVVGIGQGAGTSGSSLRVARTASIGATTEAVRASLRIVDQTSWVEPGGDAVFQIRIEAADRNIADLHLEVAVAAPVLSRGALAALLGGKRPRDWQLPVGPFPVSSLAPDASGNTVLRLGTQSPELERDPARLLLRSTGAYPIELRLRNRRDNATVATALTVLSAARRAPGPVPLRLALVWSLGVGHTVFAPDGSITDQAELALSRELGPVIQELAAQPSVRSSLQIDPAALEGLGLARAPGTDPAAHGSDAPARPDGATPGPIDALRDRVEAGDLEVVASSYGPASLGPLVRARLGDEARRQLDAARQVQHAVLGATDATSMVTGEIDGPLVVHLDRRGLRRVVVDSKSVSSSSRFTPARPFTLTDGRERRAALLAATADRDLESLLADGHVPTGVRAAQLVAGGTVTALEQPALERGIVVVVPTGVAPDGAQLVRAIEDALQSHPLLSPVRLEELFDKVPQQTDRGKPVTKSPQATPAPELTEEPGDLRSARARVSSLRTLAGPESDLVRRAERSLLLAESGDPDHPTRRYLDGALGVVRQAVAKVEGPPQQTVTLIGRRANVPVTFVNHSDHELRVEVRLQSDKLLFPEGRRRALVLLPKSTTSSFRIEARTRGSFPLFVTVTSPDGEIVVSRTEMTIRSTATSWVGRVLTIAAGVFLLTWWGLHFRGARRRSTLA